MSIEKKVEELRKKYRGILSEDIIDQTAEGYRNDLMETRIDTLKEVEEWVEKRLEFYVEDGDDVGADEVSQLLTHIQSLLDNK